LHPAVRALAFALCLVPAAHLTLDWLSELGLLDAWRSSLGADQIRDTEIRTGLWTLRFLAITLAVTPARELLGLGALAKYRRTFGLFAFFYACVHLATWSWADTNFDLPFMWKEIVKHKYILVGMLTFLLLVPLAVTSTKGWIKRLGGKRWNKLHRLIYVAAVTGTIHYLWAVKKDTLFPVVYFVVFGLLLGYRVVAREAPRRARLAARRAVAGARPS
jgi:sulfoxide reductase heme-binding subunit YedZ